MKKLILYFVLLSACCIGANAQQDSLYMFDMSINPKGLIAKVFLNTIDGKIDKNNPFSYYNKSSNEKIEPSSLPKELRIKLKKNKKLNSHSYFFKYPKLKEVVSRANYDPKHNEYLFYTPLEGQNHYKIHKINYKYSDKSLKKLESVQIMYISFVTGTIKMRDYNFKKK